MTMAKLRHEAERLLQALDDPARPPEIHVGTDNTVSVCGVTLGTSDLLAIMRDAIGHRLGVTRPLGVMSLAGGHSRIIELHEFADLNAYQLGVSLIDTIGRYADLAWHAAGLDQRPAAEGETLRVMMGGSSHSTSGGIEVVMSAKLCGEIHRLLSDHGSVLCEMGLDEVRQVAEAVGRPLSVQEAQTFTPLFRLSFGVPESMIAAGPDHQRQRAAAYKAIGEALLTHLAPRDAVSAEADAEAPSPAGLGR